MRTHDLAVGGGVGGLAAGADVRLRGLTWRPLRRRTPVLADLDLEIAAGERVLVTGPSGGGKSTLLRAMAGLLHTAAAGDQHGEALVGGQPAGDSPGGVALLLQDPAAAVVAATVGRDVAFGLENRQVRRTEIWSTVRAVLEQTSFPYGVDHPTRALSGGETQRLALAGGLALGARVLLLDEPTSMLDEPTARGVRQAVLEEVARRGCTLVVVEHRIQPWLAHVDRLIVLGANGEVVADGDPPSVLAAEGPSLSSAGVWVPGEPAPLPPHVDAGLVEPLTAYTGELLSARQVAVTLTSRGVARRPVSTQALARVDAALVAGHALAVTGPSGSGKSTLLSVLAGLQRPSAGDVVAAESLAPRQVREPWRWRSRELAARISWAPQLPEVGMVGSRVRQELMATGRAVGTDLAVLERRVDGLIALFGLERVADASPHQLSGGEQRRLMVAAALAHGPAVATFDEPTVGQDRLTWSAVVSTLREARESGVAVGLATHDGEAARELADIELRLHAKTQDAP